MKNILFYFTIITLTTILLSVIVACSSPGIAQVKPGQKNQLDSGSPVLQNIQPTPPGTNQSTNTKPENKMIKIKHVFEQFNELNGQTVMLEGKIVNECGSGCWFILDDGTGTIYVDLAPSNLVIPQKRGAFARVTGTVAQKGTGTYLIGTKVEF